jgi:predicted Zn-dependent protease
MSKKMTATIATALANQVISKLLKKVNIVEGSIEQKVKESKEYKQLVKLNEERRNISQKIDDLKEVIKNKHNTSLISVIISYNNSVNVCVNSRGINVSDIKDRILLADYLSSSPVSTEDLVDSFVDEIINYDKK